MQIYKDFLFISYLCKIKLRVDWFVLTVRQGMLRKGTNFSM